MSDSEQRVSQSVQLERLGRDLTLLSRDGKLEPIYPREELISSLSHLLSGENNVLLVGEPGVGKNALISGLAHRITNTPDNITKDLRERKILECSIVAFHEDVFYAHEFENKTRLIVQQCKDNHTILFFDNIHTAIMAGAVSDNPYRTLANLLTPYLNRKELLMIGATTPDGYDFMAKNNISFVEKFIKLEIQETSPEETISILKRVSPYFENKYHVKIDNDVLLEPVELAKRFFPWRFFPGKAIALVEEAISLCLEQGIQSLDKKAFLDVIQRKTSLIKDVIHSEISLKFDDVFKHFTESLYGQDQAIKPIVDTILAFKAQLNETPAPLGVFLFIGPTGVGKTLLAKKLADYLFGSEDRLVRFDMSEFAEYDSISKLIGDSSRARNALLVDEILAHPCSVILFDEIEKAHSNIFDLLLAITGEGRLTDSLGRTAIFSNCIIIMTSNISSEDYHHPLDATLVPQMPSELGLTEEQTFHNLQRFFRPEFINRITHIVRFNPISKEAIRKIAQKEINNLLIRLVRSKPNISVHIEDAIFSCCIEKGYIPEYGARPMKRVIRELITYPLSRLLSQSPDLTNGEIILQFDAQGDVEAIISNI